MTFAAPSNRIPDLVWQDLRMALSEITEWQGRERDCPATVPVVSDQRLRHHRRLVRTLWTLAVLDIKPFDRVLDVGCGDGLGIQLASRLAFGGHVAAIDISAKHVQQARARNAELLSSGHVSVKVASILDTPVFSGQFDKAYSINSIHWWHQPVQGLLMIRNMLSTAGKVAITLDVGSRPTSKSCSDKSRWFELMFAEAGFSYVSTRCLHTPSLVTICALASQSGCSADTSGQPSNLG
jgi:SAM-dependent methyltransferase